MPANPYQEVIDWLRSPEGEHWSELRLLSANWHAGKPMTLTSYGSSHVMIMGGMFCIKEDG